MTNLALFDMDGTLCDDRHRYDLYEAGKWDQYFSDESLQGDAPWPEGKRLWEEAGARGDVRGILTARLDRNLPASEKWLVNNGFQDLTYVIHRPESLSFMRPPEFKVTAIQAIIDMKLYDSIILYDNDPDVIEAIHKSHGESYAYHCTWDAKASFVKLPDQLDD